MNKLLKAKAISKSRIMVKSYQNDNTQIIKPENGITMEPKLNKVEFTPDESNISSGPLDYKIFIEGKSYPHSINLTKLVFKYTINNVVQSRVLYLSTGHSFAEEKYQTNNGTIIYRTDNIKNLFIGNRENIFYSLDNDFDDFALLYFNNRYGSTNNLLFNGDYYLIKSVCQNMNIKYLENELLIKNGWNTGDTFVKPLINFETDNYLVTKKNGSCYFTFKINGKLVIVTSKFNSGIISKGISSSSITKFNGEPITEVILNNQLEYHFHNIIKEFRNHELLERYNLEDKNKFSPYWTFYQKTNSLSVTSMMGDSGSGFFRILPDKILEFVGIHIGGCSILVLTNAPQFHPDIFFNTKLQKLQFGKYIIEEIHRGCQILPINQIEKLIGRHLIFPINEILT